MMNRYMKLLNPFLLILMIIVGLSACGTSLEKPTGLEETDNNQVEVTTEEKLDDEEIEIAKNDTDSEEDRGAESTETKESSNKEIKNEENNKNTPKDQSNTVPKKEQRTSSNKDKKESTKSSSNKKSTESSSKDKEKQQSKKSEPSKKETKEPVKKEKATKSTITHSIVISSSEVPLPATTMEITNGDTVLQALINITMANKVHMDYRGGQGATAYVQGMGNVYEFDRGQGSGWMYRVNGTFPDRGAGVVPLCDGDVVEWLYTTDLGVDLGADLKPVRRDGKCP